MNKILCASASLRENNRTLIELMTLIATDCEKTCQTWNAHLTECALPYQLSCIGQDQPAGQRGSLMMGRQVLNLFFQISAYQSNQCHQCPICDNL